MTQGHIAVQVHEGGDFTGQSAPCRSVRVEKR